MPTMIEKVADAISDKINSDDDGYNAIAKAAIEAMLFVTPEMAIAGTKANAEFPDSVCAIYQSMIEAAIE